MTAVVIAEEIHVSSDRYSIFAPWVNKAPDASLSANFTAYALLLDNNGKPISGQSITFKIYSPASSTTPKATKTATTQQNGLASVPYDTYPDFTSQTDTDYGVWKIDAYMTSIPTVIGSTNLKVEAGGKAAGGCGQDNCHKTSTVSGAKPLSPYTGNYNQANTRASAAHKKNNHQNAGCPACHPGYASDKTAVGSDGKIYGKTADVHKNNTCEFCHGNWAYITGTGNGIPKMPSCYQCHPVFNSNVKNISTIANLAAGNGISVYSYNYDQKKPLAAHNGTVYSLTDSVACIACHGPAHNNSKPFIGTSSTNSVTENEQCWSCHTNRATTHKSNTNCVSCHSQDAHNISIAGGGPDCISCHGSAGSALHKVDDGAIDLSVHANLNINAVASGVSVENKKCWGCHQTGGTQPSDMGDRYTNPYKCYDCHGPTKPYANVGSALTVDEHYKNGIDIKAAISATDNSASCLTCHNLDEMKVSYTDNEFTTYSLASHYGKNRSDLRVAELSTDCKYCHQNTSTTFSVAMTDVSNNNMVNHTTLATTPTCTNAGCHNSGKIHDSSLNKPVSNDALCKNCHVGKEEHKTIYCTICHANNSDRSLAGKDIHGIKYLQKDNTFLTVKTNVVDCTTCHQKNVVDSSLGGVIIPKISDPLHHSDDVINGSKWGVYWSSPIEACLLCHSDTKHNLTPLGRPLLWNPSYVMNSAIGTGNNCADCHYKGDSNYGTMSSTFTNAGLNIPPEITSGSWNGKPGYYNHSLSDYTDAKCKSCHSTSNPATVGQLMHDTTIGSAGNADCISCHNIGGSAPKTINFTVANDISAGHKNLNSGVQTTLNPENKKCWSCHGDGSEPNGHPSNYKTPLACTNCHTGTGSFNAPIVAEHSQVGTDVITPVNCTQCHSNSGMLVNDLGGIGSTSHYAKQITNMGIQPYGHSGPIDTTNCINCHNGPNTSNPIWGSPVNIATSLKRAHAETTVSQCDTCHKDATISTLANVDFHNAALKLAVGQGDNCLDCHASAQ
jgi:hypothetical protein